MVINFRNDCSAKMRGKKIVKKTINRIAGSSAEIPV